MENGLEKSKNVTKIVVNSTFAKCVTKIMVTKIKITKFIGPKVPPEASCSAFFSRYWFADT